METKAVVVPFRRVVFRRKQFNYVTDLWGFSSSESVHVDVGLRNFLGGVLIESGNLFERRFVKVY